MKRKIISLALISATLLFANNSEGVSAKYTGTVYGDGLYATFETADSAVAFPAGNLQIEHLLDKDIKIFYTSEKVFYDPTGDSLDMEMLKWVEYKGDTLFVN